MATKDKPTRPRGRPSRADGGKFEPAKYPERLSFRAPAGTMAALKTWADEEGKSVPALLRDVVGELTGLGT